MITRRGIAAATVTAVSLLMLAGCGPQSCGRKDATRVVSKDGHITTEHCQNGVWVR